MPQFLPMESLLYGTFGPIGALSAMLETKKFSELYIFLAGRELTQKVIVYNDSNLHV